MSLCALTPCCGVKIVRVIRVESWEYRKQTLHADRYYGGVGDGSQGFMTFCIGVAWQRGKVYGFLLSFHTVNFLPALHAAAKKYVEISCDELDYQHLPLHNIYPQSLVAVLQTVPEIFRKNLPTLQNSKWLWRK